MRNRHKSEPPKTLHSMPVKKLQNFFPLETQAYAFVWLFFYMFMMACVIGGIFVRICYGLIHEKYPNRKELNTFTQIRFLNRYMLVWPVLFAFAVHFTSTKDENGNDRSRQHRKSLKLNVIAQIILCYVFYYSVYYTSEVIKSTLGNEILSGHIFTGLLSSSSFVSTTIFVHHFRDRSSQIHKVFQAICFLYVFHMGYSFFWTSFVYHEVVDTYLALVIGGFLSFFIQ